MVLLEPILVQPIGRVQNNLGHRPYNKWMEVESEIVISEEYQDALYRLDEYSHIDVIFYLHERDRPFVARIHPTGNPEYPLMGAFATRTPNRPSKVALTTCKLLWMDGNVLRVRGLDAYDGSPVLDVKPHLGLMCDEIRVPSWVIDLKQRIK
jgi:tRNA (adenine37-N6)-methyltransferase